MSKRRPWDKPIHFGRQPAPEPALAVIPDDADDVQSYTLIFDRRGAQARARFITPDGHERATEWRAFNHGMFAAVNELLNDWKREGPLGGFGRIPRAASRSR